MQGMFFDVPICAAFERGAVIVMLALPSAQAWSGAGLPNAKLSVEGTAFVLHLPDGRLLKGAELQGATVQLARGDGQVTLLHLKSIQPDPRDPEILRHEYQTPDGKGGWKSACEPNFYGETWGFPIVLPKGHPGREGAITLTCSSGAVGKCVRLGYKPWAKGPHGEDLIPYHAACVRMVRADYCGDDQSHTKNGTFIDLYDVLDIQKRESEYHPDFAFEAGWAPDGAVCVAHIRWSDVVTLTELRQNCPRRFVQAEACDEASARSKGALLFNSSRPTPRIGE
jgi:hypothetical protein